MTKRVQRVGHVAATAATFIGREREITIDTDNANLHLHDGATAGGEIIPNKTFVDARDTTIEAKADQGVTDSATAQAAADAAQTTADDAIPKTVFGAAQQVIISTSPSTPASLAMTVSTILARLASGSIIAATPAQLRTLLSLVIGTDVQAQGTRLDEIAALAPTDKSFIVGTGAVFGLEGPAQTVITLDVALKENIFKHAFETGTKAIFFQASAPLGWTQDTSQNDKVLRIVSGAGGGSAGSWTITGVTVNGHILTTAQMPAHSHNFTYTKAPVDNILGGSNISIIRNINTTGETVTVATQNSTPSGGSHNHGLTSDGAWRPAYIDVIVCTKNTP